MNLPDGRGAEDFRIGEQSTHGESNPEHFLVNAISAEVSAGLGTTAKSRQPSAKCSLRHQSVQFLYSRGRKLMQKIHSLTDN
jgi:hypothetical protein